METYQITIVNLISKNKRTICVEAYSIKIAIEQASWEVHHTCEDIVKVELLEK